MNSLLKNLLLGGSATALAVGAAYAQGATAPAPTDDIETVNSSAGRLNLQGFAQPTPVTSRCQAAGPGLGLIPAVLAADSAASRRNQCGRT